MLQLNVKSELAFLTGDDGEQKKIAGGLNMCQQGGEKPF